MTTASKSRRVDRVIVVIEALVGVGVVSAIVGRSYGTASTVMFILAAISAAFTGFVLLRMFTALRDETLDIPGRIVDSERAELEHEKLLLLQGIKEFEADAAQGKVDDDDYAHLRQTAEARAVQIIKDLKQRDQQYVERAAELVQKRLGGAKVGPAEPAKKDTAAKKTPAKPDAVLAKDAPAVETAAPTFAGLFNDEPAKFVRKDDVLHCEACDQANDDDANFCIGCGRPRLREAS